MAKDLAQEQDREPPEPIVQQEPLQGEVDLVRKVTAIIKIKVKVQWVLEEEQEQDFHKSKARWEVRVSSNKTTVLSKGKEVSAGEMASIRVHLVDSCLVATAQWAMEASSKTSSNK